MVLFLTELRKTVRSRFFLTLAMLITFESLWVCAALNVQLSRQGAFEKTILYSLTQGASVHGILAPVFLTVLASRLATVEHDAHSYKLLFANNVDPRSLFWVKLALLTLSNVAMSIVHVGLICAVTSSKGILIETRYVLFYSVGICLAGITVGAIQLFLALALEKQQITLFIGGFGALLGSMTMFVPRVFARILPWQYFALLSPAVPHAEGGTIISLTFPAGYFVDMAVVILVGLISAPVLAYRFKKIALR